MGLEMNKELYDVLNYAERLGMTPLEVSILQSKVQILQDKVQPRIDLAQAVHELRVDMDQFIYKEGTLFAPEKDYYQIMQNLENLLHKIYGEIYDS